VEQGGALPVKTFLENFAAILGTITVVMLVMSVSHEYGYFWSIGRPFQTFLTTTDYLANGVLWLPLALIFMYLTIQWKDLKTGLPETPNLTKWQRRLVNGLFPVFALYFLAAATWPVDLPVGTILIFIGVVIWERTSRRFGNSVTLEDPFQLIARPTIRFGPPIILAMFIYGSVDAHTDLNRADDQYAFQFKSDATPKQRIFLRNFDKGVLVRDAAEKKIEFYKWDDIANISRAAPSLTESFLCRRFGATCENSATHGP
jgi:hypothetical protein